MTIQYWITGVSGDWSTAADWVSGVVPASTVDVVINGSNVTVTGTAVANSLTLDGYTVTVSGTLTLGTTLTVDGNSQVLLKSAIGELRWTRLSQLSAVETLVNFAFN